MRLFRRTGFRRTTIIASGLSALIVGLFSAWWSVSVPTSTLLFFTLPAAFSIFWFKKVRIVAIVTFMFTLGIWRGSMVFKEFLAYEAYFGQGVDARAVVVDDPGFNTERNQTEFTVSNISINGDRLVGKIQVSTRDEVKLNRGDSVVVLGKLKPFKGTSKQASIGSAKVQVTAKNSSFVEVVRTKFFQSVQRALPEPAASLGLGYLVGLRATISRELSDQLKIVGLTHIIAVSGYNLTVIVQAVRRLFARKSAYQAVFFTSLLLAGFLLVAGSSAPITRAAIVCAFSLLAWYYGQEVKPYILLLLGGALTAFFNPFYVWGDPGWYLSFLAFAGVLILAPLITRLLYRRKQPATLAQILLETVCAQLATVPYTLFLFGSVSVIAPLANLLVLPLIPVIMLLVFVVGVLGILFQSAAATLGIIPTVLLNLQVWFVERLSQFSFANKEVSISLSVMLGMFVLLVFVVVLLSKVTKRSELPLESEEYNLI